MDQRPVRRCAFRSGDEAESMTGYTNDHWDDLSASSWPGSSRPSTSLMLHGLEDVDARDKRGHDE
jgi:hypothetical protein